MAETTTTAWHFPEFVHWFQKNCLRSSNGPMATLILMLNPQYGDTGIIKIALVVYDAVTRQTADGRVLLERRRQIDQLRQWRSGTSAGLQQSQYRSHFLPSLGRQFLPVSIEIQIFPSGGGRTDVVCSPAGREGQVERGAFQTERPYDVGVTGETNGNRWRKEKTI